MTLERLCAIGLGWDYNRKVDDLGKDSIMNATLQQEYDLIVVGFGAAGAAAAIEAHDLGAKVLVLEKMSEGGGNSAVSGGGFIIPDHAEHAFEYLKATFDYAHDEIDEEAVRVFAEESVQLKDFFKGLDPNVEFKIWGYANYPNLPHPECITKYTIAGPATGGENLFHFLKRQVEKRDIPVFYNATVQDLLTEIGTVTGVKVAIDDEIRVIGAKKGVILTCGGYEYDPESLQTYAQGHSIGGLGSPGNTGDGLRMAQKVGAKLWHMTAYSCPLGFKLPGHDAMCLLMMRTPGYIWVDQQGKRFVNECGIDFHSALYAINAFDPTTHHYNAIPCYLILDDRARQVGTITHSLFGYLGIKEKVRLSGNWEEEAANGAFIKADSIEALARQIQVDSETLTATVNRWNTNVKNGCDTDFARPMQKDAKAKDTMVGLSTVKLSETIEVRPFWAIPLYPALLNTQGGPKRNAKAQVIGVDNEPIPGLYSAGELGSIWGTIYQGSSNIAECLVFGRIAARQALKNR